MMVAHRRVVSLTSFDLSLPGFLGACVQCDDGSERLTAFRADADDDALARDLAMEIELCRELGRAIHSAQIALPIGTMRAGLRVTPGVTPDFIAENADGSRRIGLHVLAHTDALEQVFVSRLVGQAGLLECLLVVCPAAVATDEAHADALARLQPPVEIYRRGGTGSLADQVARHLHMRLSDPIIVERLEPAKFRPRRPT